MLPDDDAHLRNAAALVALLRCGKRPAGRYAGLVEDAGSAHPVLEEEAGLLAESLVEASVPDVSDWREQGIRVLTVLDDEYPENLRAVHDRPALIFSVGELNPGDRRAVAVIGSRRASQAGIDCAVTVAKNLIGSGYTVISGLAAGIDTAAHATALECGGRTVAVLGTGLLRCYPSQNADLQRRIGSDGALLSQFWPEEAPSRKTFPMRNAVMSGLALATVIIEAGPTSGARIQARHALGHGRPLLLLESLLDQPWAQELSRRPGIHVVNPSDDICTIVDGISSLEFPLH